MDSISSQGVTFLVGLVLARLLTPHEYGLIGYIMILVAVFNSIVDSGFSNALIRKKDAGEADYSTAFIFNLAVSLVMVAAMVLVAVPFSRFFKEPQLVPLVRVMSVIVVINALALIQRTRLVKSVDFKTQTKASLLVVIVPRAVRLRLEASGVWPHRHGVEGNLPAGHRQVLLYVHIGAVHQGQAVLGHLLVQHDVDSPEGQLSCAELHPGRAGADEGGVP